MDAEAQGMLLEIPEQPAPAPLPRIGGDIVDLLDLYVCLTECFRQVVVLVNEEHLGPALDYWSAGAAGKERCCNALALERIFGGIQWNRHASFSPDYRIFGEKLACRFHWMPPNIRSKARALQHRSFPAAPADRKSTRLNSSHLGISYAVF